MRKVFKEEADERVFRGKGYVVFDLLDRTEALDLRQQAKSLKSGVGGHFYTSLWSPDAAYRQRADELVKSALRDRVLSRLEGYEPLFGDLLVKAPSLSKHFPVHQDWTFVDEDSLTSVYAWCPLQDVTPRNGCLHVVEGSHRVLDRIRGANVPVSYDGIRERIGTELLKPLPMRAGQVVIFSQALLHASPPNHSLRRRFALGLLFVPEGADLFHYYYDRSENELYKLKVDLDFFMHYSEQLDFRKALQTGTFSRPEKGELLERRAYVPAPLGLEALKHKLKTTG